MRRDVDELAWSTGETVVAGRADFTAEEWADLSSALISAAELVSFSDGGRSGMAREMPKVRRTLEHARDRHSSQLVRELAGEPGRSVIDAHMSPGEAEEPVLRVLRAAAAALSAKAPEELEAYRGFVVHLGELPDESNRSGGLVGVGGQRDSYAEAQALAKIRRPVGES